MTDHVREIHFADGFIIDDDSAGCPAGLMLACGLVYGEKHQFFTNVAWLVSCKNCKRTAAYKHERKRLDKAAGRDDHD